MSLADDIEPQGERLLVQRAVPPSTAGGLHVPETARIHRSSRGTILASGPQAPPEYKPGRQIVTDPQVGSYVTSLEGDEELSIIHPDDVLAFLPSAEPTP